MCYNNMNPYVINERLLHMTEPRKDTRRRLQTALLMLMDAALGCLSLILALQIYYDMNPPETLEQIWRAMPLLAVFSVGSLYALGLYRSLIRYRKSHPLPYDRNNLALSSQNQSLMHL